MERLLVVVFGLWVTAVLLQPEPKWEDGLEIVLPEQEISISWERDSVFFCSRNTHHLYRKEALLGVHMPEYDEGDLIECYVRAEIPGRVVGAIPL